MSGRRFAAAYIGSHEDSLLGTRLVIPDHKLYFVPVEEEDEAAFLTGFLNAPMIAGAISAYAAQLSLGASVVEYLNVPAFDPGHATHLELAALARELSGRGQEPSPAEWEALDRLARLCVPG